MNNRYKNLEELNRLYQSGALTQTEFENEKRKILSEPNQLQDVDNSYLLLMHLSLFAGCFTCFLGYIIPIIMWSSKNQNPEVDRHGKNIFNFIISTFIYSIITILLCFIFIGFLLLLPLALYIIISIIVATIKASHGEFWKYPLALPFFSC